MSASCEKFQYSFQVFPAQESVEELFIKLRDAGIQGTPSDHFVLVQNHVMCQCELDSLMRRNRITVVKSEKTVEAKVDGLYCIILDLDLDNERDHYHGMAFIGFGELAKFDEMFIRGDNPEIQFDTLGKDYGGVPFREIWPRVKVIKEQYQVRSLFEIFGMRTELYELFMDSIIK